jgi:hypothetical protein
VEVFVEPQDARNMCVVQAWLRAEDSARRGNNVCFINTFGAFSLVGNGAAVNSARPLAPDGSDAA